MRFRHFFVIAVLWAGAACAGQPDIQHQRDLFKHAYDDFRAGRTVDVEGLRAQLKGYPLWPYIEYWRLRSDLSHAEAGEVASFLRDHGDLPVAGILRADWLEAQAGRGHWQRFLQAYAPTGSTVLRCLNLRGRKAVHGVDEQWIAQAKKLWNVGYSQPRQCDPVFAVLYGRHSLTIEDVQQRVDKVMANGYVGLAEVLARRLPRERREQVVLWARAVRRPVALLNDSARLRRADRGEEIAADALKRLARSDADQAMSYLNRYRKQGLLTAAHAAQVRRIIALHAAYSRDPEAWSWLSALPDSVRDGQVRSWTAQAALAAQDWAHVVAAVSALPASERNSLQWRYWKAYALDRLGRDKPAYAIYRELAGHRNYYGFLAADRLAMPYSMNADPVTYDQDAVNRLGERPGMRRAREFFRLGILTEARREWTRTVAGLSTNGLKRAAVLASQWGWYDRAIHCANRAGLDDALGLRFPTPYRRDMERYGQSRGVDPALLYALARKESAFAPDARSRVGALGLMQLMPGTGRRVARLLNQRLGSAADLFDVNTNVSLGSAYLRQVLGRFGDNPVLAAAAYNAGPDKVSEWLNKNSNQPAALWIENITYGETRDYVKSLMAFSVVFDWKLNGKPRRISAFMPHITSLLAAGGNDLQVAADDRPTQPTNAN